MLYYDYSTEYVLSSEPKSLFSWIDRKDEGMLNYGKVGNIEEV
jgi:hypothetical protein